MDTGRCSRSRLATSPYGAQFVCAHQRVTVSIDEGNRCPDVLGSLVLFLASLPNVCDCWRHRARKLRVYGMGLGSAEYTRQWIVNHFGPEHITPVWERRDPEFAERDESRREPSPIPEWRSW